MSPVIYGTQQHWETRARAARKLAEEITDPKAKRDMLEIAESYDKLAKRAEAREAHVVMPPDSTLKDD